MAQQLQNPKDLFPHKELTKLPTNRAPTTKESAQFKKEVLTNVGAVATSLGGGQFGHMGMVLTAPKYAQFPGAPVWNDPNQPVLNIPAGATAPQIASLTAVFHSDMVVFNNHQNTSNAIRSLMIKAAPGFLWTTLNHHIYGLALVQPRTMFAHVMNHHGPINDNA